MKLEDIPTPKCDEHRIDLHECIAVAGPSGQREYVQDYVPHYVAISLEKKLGLAVAALQSISEYWRCARTMTDACEHNRNAAAEALAQIEEGKNGD